MPHSKRYSHAPNFTFHRFPALDDGHDERSHLAARFPIHETCVTPSFSDSPAPDSLRRVRDGRA